MSKWIMEIRMEEPIMQWRLQFRENTVPLMFISDYTAQHLYCSSNKSFVFPFWHHTHLIIVCSSFLLSLNEIVLKSKFTHYSN